MGDLNDYGDADARTEELQYLKREEKKKEKKTKE